MSLMTAMEVGASGLTAQRRRLEVMTSNLVNANTTRPQGVDPYRRKDVVFAATNINESFGTALDEAVQGVKIVDVTTDRSDPVMRYEPGHPHADAKGYVAYPNINPLEEMVNVMSSTRSYEANLQVVGMARDMLQKTLEILR